MLFSEASRRLLSEIGKTQMEALPTGKQAGPDRIPNEVYKYLSTVFAPKLGPSYAGPSLVNLSRRR